jgi:hypothetical protein
MAKNKTNKKSRQLLILISIFIVFVIIYVLLLSSKSKLDSGSNYQAGVNYQNTTQSKEMVFTSKLGKFSIVVPEGFTAVGNYTDATLKSKDGEINVVRNGTNYDNLKDYINTFDSRRNIIITKVTPEKVDGYEAIAREELFVNTKKKEKSYYIYAANFVYIFSTDSEALYADLDQIALSFKYTP